MAQLGALVKKIRWSLAQRGLAGTMRVMLQRTVADSGAETPLAPHPFDVEHGVDTGGLIGGGALSTGHAHDRYITAYVGIAPSRFKAVVARWLATPETGAVGEYTFIDLGCGKGRAVMLASQMGFRQVIGVELNPELAAIAEKNLALWKDAGLAGCPMRIVCGDALEFTLPAGPCVVFLFNPFAEPVMTLLVRRLAAREGRLDVLYQNPEQDSVFRSEPRMVPLWSEVLPLAEEDRGDPVATDHDVCNAYRLDDKAR